MCNGLRISLLVSLFFFASNICAELLQGAIPTKRTVDYEWMSVKDWERYHAEDQLIAAHDKVDVLFIGDSITAGWNKHLWDTHFHPLRAANFAIGGDNTGNVLWRLQHGTIGQLNPALIVVLIGVNNLGGLQETPEQAAKGVTRVVQQLTLAWPQSRVLLQAVLPFDENPDSPNRAKVTALNQQLAQLADGERIIFKDYGALLLEDDGRISPRIMPDFLHPSAEGYARWVKQLAPDVKALLTTP